MLSHDPKGKHRDESERRHLILKHASYILSWSHSNLRKINWFTWKTNTHTHTKTHPKRQRGEWIDMWTQTQTHNTAQQGTSFSS